MIKMARTSLVLFQFFLHLNLIVYSNDLNKDLLKSNLIKIKHDTAQVNRLLILSEESVNKDSIECYIQMALQLSGELNYKKGIADAMLLQGVAFENEGKTAQALTIYQKALDIGNKTRDAKIIANAYNNLGRIYKSIGDVSQALNSFKISLKYFETIGDKKGEAIVLSNIGVLHKKGKDVTKALEYYYKSLKLRKSINDQRGIADSYQNIANCLNNLGEADKKMFYYKESLKIKETINDRAGEAGVLISIGSVFKKTNQPDSALLYIKRGLKLFEDAGNKDGITSSYFILGSFYADKNQLKKAEEVTLRSLEMAKELGFAERIRNAAELLAKIYGAQNMYEKAYNMQRLTNESNKIFHGKESEKILAVYEVEKKVNEVKLEVERQKTIRNFSIGGFIIFIIGTSLIIFFYNSKREAQNQLEIAGARMKAMNAQLNQHFIFSSLSSIRAYMTINFEKADDYLVRFARFVRSILNHSDDDTISLKQELEETENYMVLEQFRFANIFEYDIKIDPTISAEDFQVPPLLLQPIVENSIKHGFTGIEYKGKIGIAIRKENNVLICELTDNGKGFSTTQGGTVLKRKSFGTKLTISRIEIFNKMNNQKAYYHVEEMEQGIKTILKLPAIT